MSFSEGDAIQRIEGYEFDREEEGGPLCWVSSFRS